MLYEEIHLENLTHAEQAKRSTVLAHAQEELDQAYDTADRMMANDAMRVEANRLYAMGVPNITAVLDTAGYTNPNYEETTGADLEQINLAVTTIEKVHPTLANNIRGVVSQQYTDVVL